MWDRKILEPTSGNVFLLWVFIVLMHVLKLGSSVSGEPQSSEPLYQATPVQNVASHPGSSGFVFGFMIHGVEPRKLILAYSSQSQVLSVTTCSSGQDCSQFMILLFNVNTVPWEDDETHHSGPVPLGC